MKIDVNMTEAVTEITFFVEELKGPKSHRQALMIIEAMALDFEVDPEMTEEDVGMLAQEAKEGGHADFTVEISDEGVEALA